MIAITNRRLCAEPLPERVSKLAEAGAEMIILREKDLPRDEMLALAYECLVECEKYGVPLSVNSAVDVARELDICRIHLPLDMLRTGGLNGFSLVGASVHSTAEAIEAEGLGADYLIAGHVFPTACKLGMDPRGTGFLEDVCSAVDIPVYAVGGVTAERHRSVMEAGAAGSCSMSGAMTANDVREFVRSLSLPW